MILVTGAVTARPDTIGELTRACIAHSRRSRAEPGCISHHAHVDCENPLRIFFHEVWADRAVLAAHFRVPESSAFLREARRLSAEIRGPEIFEATRLDP